VQASLRWNMCDWRLHVDLFPSLEYHADSAEPVLRLAAAHLDEDFTVVWVCPELLRILLPGNLANLLGIFCAMSTCCWMCLPLLQTYSFGNFLKESEN